MNRDLLELYSDNSFSVASRITATELAAMRLQDPYDPSAVTPPVLAALS